jgi:hypothetical protein
MKYTLFYFLSTFLSSTITSSLLFNEYRGSFPVGKRPGREVDHEPLCSADVTNEWSYIFFRQGIPVALELLNKVIIIIIIIV